MKKWIWIIGVSLSLVAIAFTSIYLYPVAQLLLAEDEQEPLVVSNVNILSKLREVAGEKESLQYLVLGDSVARGLGSGKAVPHGYSSLVVKGLGEEERIPLELSNQGVSGQTSERLLQSLEQTEIREQVADADLISLTIGGNDLLKEALRQNNPVRVLSNFEHIQQTYNSNLDQILKEIRTLNPDAPILLTSLYNPISPSEPYYGMSNKLLRQWNLGMKKTAYHYPLTHVVDVYDRLRTAQGEWLHDEIHPNEQGYRLIADGILEEIRNQAHSSASNR
ncbi:GDSL-type esterase/lipase family protein [Desmospora profundinema]|uniref:Lysophospholipase L1-like esterase n=1 Tax=Desmospora profundinema TaxID=1571184 RepID=A0ABU1IJR1_9BACL|nr:GDSL-type esterase/lipase family protein [Desmospora profundinema]MDR6225017.1 lysophospholipase L1-like esterase [Desmospora profundinema]